MRFRVKRSERLFESHRDDATIAITVVVYPGAHTDARVYRLEGAVGSGAAMTGRCRFCGCSALHPCPGGCSWLDDRQTVCSACEVIALLWAQLPRRNPHMVAAFFRGFVQATGDPRLRRFVVVTDALDGGNPYRGEAARWWDLGHQAGEAVLRESALARV